jgi:coenzyme F420-0:L-glutamate ligase/coenzyme F420-1:gamma-L-glutamate ligase
MTTDDHKPDPKQTTGTARIELVAVPGLPDFAPGDDLAAHIADAMTRAGIRLQRGDVVVIAQKAVSKCEGAFAELGDVEPGPRALELATATGKDARLLEVILADSSEVLRVRDGLIIVANRAGHVMANAGVDASNVDGGGERVLRLPRDADHSALQLMAALERIAGIRVGVVINDSWGRAWRNGTTGHAVGVAGIPAVWDRRGEMDMHGRELRVTQIGIADEIAAAASLVMGAAGERQPVVIVRGLALPAGEGSSRDLVRERSRDLFR